eukprot:422927-Pelagomonas_calceolata.AAC.1
MMGTRRVIGSARLHNLAARSSLDVSMLYLPSGLEGVQYENLLEGLKDFIACQGLQPPLANSLTSDHPFIAVDSNHN